MQAAALTDTFSTPAYEEYSGHRIVVRPVGDGAGGFNCDCTITVFPDALPLLKAGITGSHPTREAAYAVGIRNAKTIIDCFGLH